jgi:hypothetical protein
MTRELGLLLVEECAETQYSRRNTASVATKGTLQVHTVSRRLVGRSSSEPLVTDHYEWTIKEIGRLYRGIVLQTRTVYFLLSPQDYV